MRPLLFMTYSRSCTSAARKLLDEVQQHQIKWKTRGRFIISTTSGGVGGNKIRSARSLANLRGRQVLPWHSRRARGGSHSGGMRHKWRAHSLWWHRLLLGGFDFTLEARWTLFVLLWRKNCQPVTDCTGGKEAKSRGGKAVAPYLSIPFFFFSWQRFYF